MMVSFKGLIKVPLRGAKIREPFHVASISMAINHNVYAFFLAVDRFETDR